MVASVLCLFLAMRWVGLCSVIMIVLFYIQFIQQLILSVCDKILKSLYKVYDIDSLVWSNCVFLLLKSITFSLKHGLQNKINLSKIYAPQEGERYTFPFRYSKVKKSCLS